MSETKYNKLGLWSFVATLMLLFIIAIESGGMEIVLKEFPLLLSGKVKDIPVNNTTFLAMFVVILATEFLDITTSFIFGFLSESVLGRSRSHAIGRTMKNLHEDNIFFWFFILVVAEEIGARWFFLGYLTQYSFLSGTLAFYLLFFLGNGLWAYIHIYNFDDESERHFLRILPQFVGGAFLTFIFVKYGLFASILAHFICNAVAFAYSKMRGIEWEDIASFILAGIYAIASYNSMTKPISDILQWFSDKPAFTISGWELWDYIKLYTLITSIMTMLFIFLLYDRRKPREEYSLTIRIVARIIGTPMTVIVIYGLFYVMGMFFESVPYRILALAILLAFFEKDASGSAMAETFWTGLVGLYIGISIISALGFWDAVWFLFIMTILRYPFSLLTKENEY